MAFLKNLDHLFEEKSFRVKILEKVKNPKTYIPLVPYLNLWHYSKHSKNKNLLMQIFYGLYAVPPTLKLAWIGVGIYTGAWSPLEQYKKIENFIKPEKEINQKINEKGNLNLHTDYLAYSVLRADSIKII